MVDAVRASPEDTAEEVAELADDEAMTRRAMEILDSGQEDAYPAALKALQQDTRAWWEDEVEERADSEEEDEALKPDADCLQRFLERTVLPWYEDRRSDIANRPLIREQAYGEALNPHRLEKLSRYEVHLDRKLERTLRMLFKLKELRGAAVEG